MWKLGCLEVSEELKTTFYKSVFFLNSMSWWGLSSHHRWKIPPPQTKNPTTSNEKSHHLSSFFKPPPLGQIFQASIKMSWRVDISNHFTVLLRHVIKITKYLVFTFEMKACVGYFRDFMSVTNRHTKWKVTMK